jgi:hypothetical protein
VAEYKYFILIVEKERKSVPLPRILRNKKMNLQADLQ